MQPNTNRQAVCSILIPSRNRPEQLKKAILSFGPPLLPMLPWDIFVRYDDDDALTREALKDVPWTHKCHVHFMQGPRYEGYLSLNTMYTEMANACGSKWVWIWNDDCTFEGPWNWWEQLDDIRGNVLFQPEYHWLNSSLYPNDTCSAFPIARNESWDLCGRKDIPNPADSGLFELLVNQNSWKVKFLKGVSAKHDWDNSQPE